MKFSFKKPSHIFALVIVAFIFFIFYVMNPVIILTNMNTASGYKSMTETSILINSTVIIILLVGGSFTWLYLVNRLKPREILSYLRLTRENIDTAFLWGIIALVSMFTIQIIISLAIFMAGIKAENPIAYELASSLSVYSMIFISVFQSTSEEIFFRGFLLRKIEDRFGGVTSVISTALLFGFAHISYDNVYQIVMPIILGLILGYIVIKTRNLTSSIIAHISFNLLSFAIYIAVYKSSLTL